jgi:hypothetical protein
MRLFPVYMDCFLPHGSSCLNDQLAQWCDTCCRAVGVEGVAKAFADVLEKPSAYPELRHHVEQRVLRIRGGYRLQHTKEEWEGASATDDHLRTWCVPNQQGPPRNASV